MTNPIKIRAFLERLANDDSFRQLTQESPEQALAEYEIEFRDADIPYLVTLPSKELLRERLGEFEEQLGQGPIVFGAWMQVFEPPDEP